MSNRNTIKFSALPDTALVQIINNGDYIGCTGPFAEEPTTKLDFINDSEFQPEVRGAPWTEDELFQWWKSASGEGQETYQLATIINNQIYIVI